MSLTIALEAMVAAGCLPEQILAVVRAHEAIEQKKLTEKRSKDAERQRKSRLSRGVTVTPVTPCDTPPSPSLSPSPSSFPPHPPTNNPLPLSDPHPPSALRLDRVFNPTRAREDFSRFRKAYPRRNGANPWTPAEKKFLALIRAGQDAEEIISGAAAYAASVANSDPQYTAQAVTWLNQGRWRDDHSMPAARAGPLTQADVLNELKRKVNGNAEPDQHDIKDVTPLAPEPRGRDSVANLFEPAGRKMAGGTLYDLHASGPDTGGPATFEAKAWRTG